MEAARKTYAGAHAGKAALYGVEPGSESGWASLSGPQPLGLAVDTYQYLVFNDPKWDYHTLDVEKDVADGRSRDRRDDEHGRSESEAVLLAWREAADVSRMGRSWNSSHVQR